MQSGAADKDKIYSICSTPEIWERKFCNGLGIKFTSPLGEIQKAMAHQRQLRNALILVIVSVREYKRLNTYEFVFHYYWLPHGAWTSGKCHPWHEYSNIYTTYTTI